MAIGTVYKVTRKSSSWRPVSACADWEHQVEYEEGVAVKPILQDSLLFAFSTLANAVYFLANTLGNQDRLHQIWEAEGEEPKPLTYISGYRSYIASFWKMFNDGEYLSAYANPAPIGTVGCRSIKLVRKITRQEIEETRRVAV